MTDQKISKKFKHNWWKKVSTDLDNHTVLGGSDEMADKKCYLLFEAGFMHNDDVIRILVF